VWSSWNSLLGNSRSRDARFTAKLYKSVKHLHEASVWSKPEMQQALVEELYDRIDPPPPTHLGVPFAAAIAQLVDLEAIIFDFPDLDLTTLSLKEQLELRQVLRTKQQILENADHVLNALAAVIVDSLSAITQNLPQLEQTKSPLTVPLSVLVKDLPQVMGRIIANYVNDTAERLNIGRTVSGAFISNIQLASGIQPGTESNKPLVMPHEVKMSALDIVPTFLNSTPFFLLLAASTSFQIPKSSYCRHGICVARPGWGKSQLLGLLLREAVEDPEERAVILVDPHGPLYAEAKDRMPPERTVLIDCDVHPPDLNILDFGVLSEDEALNTFEFLLSSLAGGLSEKQQACVEPLFALLKNIPGANLATLHDIVTERPKKGQPLKYATAMANLEQEQRDFFELLFYTGNFQETRDALQWKFSRALSRPAFKKMFGAQKNSIDIDRFIRARKIVLVKGGEKALGREGMRILLLYLLSQYYAAGKRREGTNEKHLAMILIDEAHLVLQSNLIKPVLQELRKFNFAFLAATQLWDDVATEVKPAILGATAIKIIGDVQRDDSEVFARDMHTTGEFIRSLRAVERSHAEWAFYVEGFTDKQSIRVRCPYGVLEAMKIERRFTQAGKPPLLEDPTPKDETTHSTVAPSTASPPKTVATSAPHTQSPISDVADTDHIKPVPE
jgi:Helicase HerA, central domain